MEYFPIIIFVSILAWAFFRWRWKRNQKLHSTEYLYQKQFPKDYL